jgi:hypothetical protein
MVKFSAEAIWAAARRAAPAYVVRELDAISRILTKITNNRGAVIKGLENNRT